MINDFIIYFAFFLRSYSNFCFFYFLTFTEFIIDSTNAALKYLPDAGNNRHLSAFFPAITPPRSVNSCYIRRPEALRNRQAVQQVTTNLVNSTRVLLDDVLRRFDIH